MKNWRIITVLLLCLVLASATACNPFAEKEEEVSQQLVEVVRGDLTVSVSGSGNIDVYTDAELTFGTGGKVDRIYVKEGDEVSEGDILAKLDTDALELALTQAELARDQTKAAIDQAQVAYLQAKLAIDQAQVAYLQAKLAIDQTEYNLDKAREPSEEDIANAEATIAAAEYYLEYAQWMQAKAGTGAEKRRWKHEVYRAQLDLDIARQELDDMLSPDEEEIAILEMQVKVAESQLEAAELQLGATESELGAADLQVEVAGLQLEAAEQGVAQAQKQLDEATITAPFDGVVADIGVDERDTVLAATTIIHLIDPTSMELKAEVDEIDIPDVREGQKAVIDVDALPELQLEGKVTSISLLPEVEAGVTVYEVKIGLDVSQDLRLKVGMSATADIIIDERSNVLLVPSRAIKLDSQGNTVVEVMVDGQVQERPVVIGISDGYQTEIVDGLDEGELVARKAS